MRWNQLNQEACPVARGLSVVGDRWTLLILRDCFLGVRRFDRFQENLGLTRHVLADRLKKLEKAGILRREPYQDRPVRHEYRLTDAGKDLYPTLMSLMAWADRHVPTDHMLPFEVVSRDTGEAPDPLLIDQKTGRPITYRSVRARPSGEES